jgi:hypothetical protein
MEARNTGWSSIKLLQFLLHLEHGKDMITTDYNSGEKMERAQTKSWTEYTLDRPTIKSQYFLSRFT